jgi:hypothetical protein
MYTNHSGQYGVLDQFAEAHVYLKTSNLGFDDTVNVLVEGKWSGQYSWIPEYNVRHFLGLRI